MGHKLFLFLYVAVILMPAFRVLDVISSQGLFLCIVNFLSTSFLFFKLFIKNKDESKQEFLKNNLLVTCFFFFLIWSSITTFWAINKSESFRVLTEFFVVLLSFINILIHGRIIKTNKVHLIFCVLFFMQFFELSFLVYDYLIDVLDGIFRPGSMSYIGLTGNKNIASFSVLIKIPVLMYFILAENEFYLKKWYKRLSYVMMFLSSYVLFYITLTRGAQVAFFLLVFFFLAFQIFSSIREKKKLATAFKINFKFLAPIIFSVLIGSSFSKSQVSINENISTAFENTDSSSNERLRFYKYALEIIQDNFFTGTGIGSWELESIEKDRLEMKSYVVPYHTHNDFLEIFSETGVFGFIFLYVPILLIYFLLFKSLFSRKNKDKQMLSLIIFLMLSMYLADALINFPFARVIQNINLIFMLTLSLYVLEKQAEFDFFGKIKIFKSLNFLFLFLFLLTPLSIYSSYRLFKSSRDQSLLLYAFNQNNFKIFKKDELSKIEKTYPNLTLTALPISTIIAMHYFSYGDLDKAEDSFREAIKANPYLNVNQSYLGKVFEKKGELDSAKYYTKYAFDKMPNNPVHFAHYLQVLVRDYDTVAIKQAYQKVIYKERDSRFQKLYLLAMSNLLDKDEGRMVINDIKQSQLENDGLKGSYYILKLGKEKVTEGYVNYLKAESYFKNGDFKNASEFYDLAFENNPLEYPYIENAAISYLRSGKLEIALDRINEVINNMNSQNKNGKSFYVRGLIYLEKGERLKACENFKKANEMGFNSGVAYSSYCI